MIIKTAKFLVSCSNCEQCPVYELPQIAFVGKSNVGKSSLINFITNNGKLARTSQEPGRTKLINYFLINDNFILVDLPGYGYSKASKSEKESWAELIDGYLSNEKRLSHIFLLIDLRRVPSENDLIMFDYIFKCNLPFTVIATKADKLSKSQVSANVRAIATELKIGEGNIIVTSATTKSGRNEIYNRIDQILNNQE
ncbi:MAG: ribosome biogenesis GTP-binding protein YihA/YsxC [Clostridia bacterium]